MMDGEKKGKIDMDDIFNGAVAQTNHFAGLHEMQERITHAIAEFQQTMQNAFKRASEAQVEVEQAFRRAINVDLSFMGPVLQELSQFGWYLNLSMNVAEVAGAKRVLATGDENQLNLYMVEVVKEELIDDVGRLCKHRPNRCEAIEQALKAHNAGLYYASIPVIFAQIDGLSYELTGYKFFDNDRRTFAPEIAKWVANNSGTSSLDVAFLSVLLDKGAFQKNRRDSNRISFTRHSILHGETTDYGTEINSLKAFSLLLFLSDMCTP